VDAAWRRTRLLVLQRDGYRCQIRGPKCTGRATHVDHVLGRSESTALLQRRAELFGREAGELDAGPQTAYGVWRVALE